MRGYFQSAGEHVGVDCRLPWVSRLIREVSPDAFTLPPPTPRNPHPTTPPHEIRTPPPHPTKSAPRHRDFVGTPGPRFRGDPGTAISWGPRVRGGGGPPGPEGGKDSAFGSVAAAAHTCHVRVEAGRAAFDLEGFEPLARGAWRRRETVVMENVCTSGFDLLYRREEGLPTFTFRWRPPLRDRLASAVAPSRSVLLVRAALMQYPVLWLAGTRGRALLHAAACTAGGATPLLAGPGGVGKSTLLAAELAAGARATCDNLCVSDGRTVWGLVEPLKVAAGVGRRMPHGRGETPLEAWVPELVPDRLVVLRRGLDDGFAVHGCDPDAAVRSLVTGTYAAGELRRYWAVAAILTAATGLGPVHPPVVNIAQRLASNLPCLEIVLPREPGVRLADLLTGLPARPELPPPSSQGPLSPMEATPR
jgi:hypothetical protein